jgi:hypothetical protein
MRGAVARYCAEAAAQQHPIQRLGAFGTRMHAMAEELRRSRGGKVRNIGSS